MNRDILLRAIGSTEASTFQEFCSALGEHCPAKGDRTGWASLFGALDEMQREVLVSVVRKDGKIEALRLTAEGAKRARKLLNQGRALFAMLPDEED